MGFPERLNNSIWHTTSIDRYASISESGYLLPEPDIDDKHRWKTANGKQNYPYVRILGGVSLFEFNNFDSEEYSRKYPVSMWGAFIPYRREWKSSIWIEIEKEKIIDNFISGVDLLAMWKEKGMYRHTIMPIIEAAYIGALSTAAFKNVFISSVSCPDLAPYEI